MNLNAKFCFMLSGITTPHSGISCETYILKMHIIHFSRITSLKFYMTSYKPDDC